MSHMKMTALFSLLLTPGLLGCGESDMPAEMPTDQMLLSGRIDGWSQGGNFQLQAAIVTLKPPMPTYSPALASGTIDSAGNFTITLPGRAAVMPYFTATHCDSTVPTDCSGTLKCDRMDNALASLDLKAVSGTMSLTLYHRSDIINRPATYQTVQYYFSDQADRETADYTCTDTSGTYTLIEDLTSKAGWNASVLSVTESGSTTTEKRTSGEIPSSLKWYAFEVR